MDELLKNYDEDLLEYVAFCNLKKDLDQTLQDYLADDANVTKLVAEFERFEQLQGAAKMEIIGEAIAWKQYMLRGEEGFDMEEEALF